MTVSVWVAMAGLAFAVLTPLVLAWLTVWYNSKRTNEILRIHAAKDADHDMRIRVIEGQLIKLTAEVEGLAGKIFTKLDTLQESVSTLTQRINYRQDRE